MASPRPNPAQQITITDLPRSVRDPRVTTPTMVVLLGSTPALAALELMYHLLTLNEEDRRKVGMVFIDTDDVPAELRQFREQNTGAFQEFVLRIAVPVGVSNVPHLPQGPHGQIGQFTEQFTFIRGKVPQFFSNGAGGDRNNGHVAACFAYNAIRATLQNALDTITSLSTSQNATRPEEVQVNIVSFLGGGTGSGIMPDIAVIARDLLKSRPGLKNHRINLFCMLPGGAMYGAANNQMSWRRSNATAALIEILALSLAAAAEGSTQIYWKYMRDKAVDITNDPIAREVYLIGQANMREPSDAARIVGMDIFQRITDASGVGFMEHSKGVDRRLNSFDERNLPMIFSSSCPLETRFSAEEAAEVFGMLSASKLLPLLGGVHQNMPRIGQDERNDFVKKWREVAQINAVRNNPLYVEPPPQFQKAEFETANLGQLNILWGKIERIEREWEARIKDVVERQRQSEFARIDAMPSTTGPSSITGVLDQRVQYLYRLVAEYDAGLEDLSSQPKIGLGGRPTDLESHLMDPVSPLLGWIKPYKETMEQQAVTAVWEAYNRRVRNFVLGTRRQFLEKLLTELRATAREALANAQQWALQADVVNIAQDLETRALNSLTWRGRLDRPHPYVRHIFDLQSLQRPDRSNIAMEQFYRWATAGMDATTDKGQDIDYSGFIVPCQQFLNRAAQAAQANQTQGDLEDINPARIGARVVDFFRDYYLRKFEDVNLFEMLDRAAPRSQTGVARPEQIAGYLYEHLDHIRNLAGAMVAFESALSPQGTSSLDTSVYLGVHWRDGAQKTILNRAVGLLGAVPSGGQTPLVGSAIDPHRLQISYGMHAFSLSMVRDFYLSQNDSAMHNYMIHRQGWEYSNGTGNPVHASGEMERLCTTPDALAYRDPSGRETRVPLYERVIRDSPSAGAGGPAGYGRP